MLRPGTISVVLAAASHVLCPWHFQHLSGLHQHPSTNCPRPQEQILRFFFKEVSTGGQPQGHQPLPLTKSSTAFKKRKHNAQYVGLSILKSCFVLEVCDVEKQKLSLVNGSRYHVICPKNCLVKHCLETVG